MSFQPPLTPDYDKENPEDWKIYEALINKCPMKEPALSVLKWRGVSDELIKKKRLGYIDNVALVFTDLAMTFGANRLKEAGLVFRKGPHEGKYLFTFHKILIPFIEKGNIKYIRSMKIEKETKWLFQDVLKNLDYIYNAEILSLLKPGDILHITESILDCLYYLDNDQHAVQISGTRTLTDENIELLKPFKIVVHRNSANPDSEFSRNVASFLTNRELDVSRGEMPTL